MDMMSDFDLIVDAIFGFSIQGNSSISSLIFLFTFPVRK